MKDGSKDKVRKAIFRILQQGILNIRTKSVSDPSDIWVESNHLHNLPFLLYNFKDELVEFYFQVERKKYISELKAEHREAILENYKEYWDVIEEYLSRN